MFSHAIDAAIEEGIQQYPPDREILAKQELEFYALLPLDLRRGNSSILRLRDDIDLENVQSNALARELILRVLGGENDLLNAIAGRACCRELRIDFATAFDEEIQQNDTLNIFYDDIYIYLKAWLMQSIKYDSEMPVADIKQRYPNEIRPDKQAYIRVLLDIQSYWIYRPYVQQRLESDYKTHANEIIHNYLDKLIEQIQNYTQEIHTENIILKR